jgi:superfamily II DNA or RNA helicase
MLIEVQNPVFSRVFTAEDAKIIATFLKFKASYWRQTQFRKVEKAWEKPLIKKGVFLTGFIPRIQEYCKSRNIPFQLKGADDNRAPHPVGRIEDIQIPGGLKLKPDQVEAINNVIHQHRGVIHHPTGSGKTVIFLSLISIFPKSKVLIIVNTQDLLTQTAENANGFFPGEVGIVGGGELNPQRITVATIQTLSKFTIDEFDFDYDIVIVDEAHHVSKFARPFDTGKGGTYARVLSMVPAPIRLGFTATLPYTEEAKLALEGYIGPVISVKKISEVERLAKIKIILKKLPITLAARESRQYPDVYKYAVTYNSRRHKMVLETASELVAAGRTVLVLVTQVQHGQNVLSMAQRSFPHLRIEYVHGQIAGASRGQIKKDLNSGKLDVVIADAVWREGVDIPTLGAIINASGGKSEIMTLQSLGRGLRTVPGIKEDVILVDFFDPSHRYLVEHFGLRLCLYFDENWMRND